MDKNEFVENLSQVVIRKKLKPFFIHRRPYTVCTLRVMVGNKIITGAGFSKVTWPDEWSIIEGRKVAFESAVRDFSLVLYNAITDASLLTGIDPKFESVIRWIDEDMTDGDIYSTISKGLKC